MIELFRVQMKQIKALHKIEIKHLLSDLLLHESKVDHLIVGFSLRKDHEFIRS